MYYWKGLQNNVNIHVKLMSEVQKQNLYPQHNAQLHSEVPWLPMNFIANDLIGYLNCHCNDIKCTLTKIHMLKIVLGAYCCILRRLTSGAHLIS